MDLAHYIPHVLITAGGGALIWFGKYMFQNAVTVVGREVERLRRIDSTLEDIKENHLVHIEQYTGKTVEVLERIEVGQAEMSGFLKGIGK